MMLIGTEKNPKGPSFKGARLRQKNLSGTLLSFKAPVPSGEANIWFKETPDTLDIYQSEAYNVPYNMKNYRGDAREMDVYTASWEFKGLPIIQGYMGEVTMAVDVFALDVLPANESLFEPTIFAREIMREIELGFLGEQHDGIGEDPGDFTGYIWPNYLAPINWQWITQDGVDWLYFEAQPLRHSREYFCWFTPIGHRHYLRCAFFAIKSVSNAGNPYRRAQRIPTKPYTDLMHQIMDSLELHLSPEAQKQKAEVAIPPKPWPVLAPTPEQIRQAKYVMYMWSGAGYEGKKDTDDHRAPPEEVAAFIDKRLQPSPLPGSYSNKAQLTSKKIAS